MIRSWLRTIYPYTLKGIDKNKAFVDATKNLKAAVIKDLKTNKITHTTILGLDVALCLTIAEAKVPAATPGFFNRFKNINSARDNFFNALPRFSLVNNFDRSKFPRIPVMVHLDFPSPYIEAPDFPEFKVLMEVPANISNEQYYHIFHSFVIRNFFDGYLKAFLTSEEKAENKRIYGLLNTISQSYAEALFSSKDFSEKAFPDMNDKFKIELISHKAVMAENLKAACIKAIVDDNPQVKLSASFVEDSDYGFKIPDESTDITLADPETLDYPQFVDLVVINSKLKSLADDVSMSSKELDKFVQEGKTIATAFYDFMKTQKPVKNSELANFLKSPALKKHLSDVSLLNEERSIRLQQNLNKLDSIMQGAKELWLMADVLTYKPLQNTNFDGQALKNTLMRLMVFQYIWKTCQIYSFDVNLPLEGLLSDITVANEKNGTHGFDFLQKWAYSVSGTFIEINRLTNDWKSSQEFQTKVQELINK